MILKIDVTKIIDNIFNKFIITIQIDIIYIGNKKFHLILYSKFLKNYKLKEGKFNFV